MTRGLTALLFALAVIACFAPFRAHADERQSVAALIASYDWPVETMVAIAQRESRLSATALNRDCWPEHPYEYWCVGVFQHIVPAGSPETEALMNPYRNVQLAFEKYQANGLKPWGY